MIITTILDRNFSPTWKKMEPYVAGNWERLGDAQKAVYAFLCKAVKGSLTAQINALDSDSECSGDGVSVYRPRLDGQIVEALNAIRVLHSQNSLSWEFVSGQIIELKGRADTIMEKEVSCGGKCLGFIPCC